ncbi:hypothetical protein NIES970_27890 (plasmid) [[Synechococcus] sp. NIES-970]|nr:hypothetical protein NIES970_27890 [[Synechococcus] sp. NIES-970]
MGPENQYEASIEIQCECGQSMSIKFHCWEYPAGIVNESDIETEGIDIIKNECALCPDLHV